MSAADNQSFDYIVVGSGAGGGTVAARLAENGRKVLVLEAGGDPLTLKGGDAAYPKGERLPDDYNVPVFHACSTENEAIRWDYWVRHYADDALQKQDHKFIGCYDGKRVDAIWYPRAGCLGGCTAHNAMITVYPNNKDWDDIAKLINDASWRSGHMRKYFERLENCRHRFFPYRWLGKLRINPTRHGWNGWLHTEIQIPESALTDFELVGTLKELVLGTVWDPSKLVKRIVWWLRGQGDPNDWRLVDKNAVGLFYAPLTTRNHSRISTRERLLETRDKHPDNLTIELDALVTRVLLDSNNRAIGVEYLKGARLYQAHAKPSQEQGEVRQAHASREVILAGGAFNTPQLLMLSGIGPRTELEKHGIAVKVDLPGVGGNLQDRYEVGVVNRVKENWRILKDARYASGDPQYSMWANGRRGVYGSNGAVLAVIRKSFEKRPVPDLFCFVVLCDFRGYFPGYSKIVVEKLNYLTWAVLKAHTNNRAGEVRLKSANPRERPVINFNYFSEGTPDNNEDLDSAVEGVKFVRELCEPLRAKGVIVEEEAPGSDCTTHEQIRDFVRYQSWGHHASCTCAIGADGDRNAVLDKDFRVRGAQGLRVVDASVFPRIPGMFIVSAVYMIAEKAADVILGGVSGRASH
jgi:choline dehydrogenase-like flavoprotein